MAEIKYVIAFTGAFGSGCTTAAKFLRDDRQFKFVSLSDPLKTLWRERHGEEKYERFDLQKLGDELRKAEGVGTLVQRAFASVAEEECIAVDCVRNIGEINALRDRFGFRLCLVAVLSTKDARWDRISSVKYTDKGLTKNDFDDDDERDRNEETEHGQQVELCLDHADIILDNSGTTSDLKTKVLGYADLFTGKERRPPTPAEGHMNMAFSAANTSQCLKRHVGAVIVGAQDRIVAVGHNDNPADTKACADEPTYDNQCYRDLLKQKHFTHLASRDVRCPRCGQSLRELREPPWRCPTCAAQGVKTNLEPYFFPDRAMWWCTAIHAEADALESAGERARGGTLYTTTFPCFQCAQKLTHAGIVRVVYTEIYPDPHSGKRLELSGIELEQFEGVRSSFERFFPRPT